MCFPILPPRACRDHHPSEYRTSPVFYSRGATRPEDVGRSGPYADIRDIKARIGSRLYLAALHAHVKITFLGKEEFSTPQIKRYPIPFSGMAPAGLETTIETGEEQTANQGNAGGTGSSGADVSGQVRRENQACKAAGRSYPTSSKNP